MTRPSATATRPSPPEAPHGPDSAVSADVVAAWLGISPRAVRQHAERGTVIRVGEGQYALQASVTAYCRHLRDAKGGRSAGLAGERESVAREQAEKLRMANAATRRELIPAADVAAEWARILIAVRSRLLAVPSRAGLPPDVAVRVDAELRAALAELAEDDD